MKKIDNDYKINLIKKYYKKEKIYLELKLVNYEGNYIYVIITYNKKNDVYKLRWFNLIQIIDKNVDKYMSCTYISNSIIDMIEEDFSKFEVSSKFEDEFIKEEDVVCLKANIKTKVDNEINVKFKRYLPKSLKHLLDLFIFIFGNMPKEFEPFLYETMAELTGTTQRYDYKREIEFNLFEDDIDKLFSYQIIERGKKYYDEARVSFLEKIDERYFAIVEGTKKYLIIIKYNEDEEKMKVYCSCPCEFYCKHIYTVILAIRNKKFNKFYKIIYKNPDEDLLKRIMNFNYSLCLGIVEQNFEVVNNYGEIEQIPILDKNEKYNWEVLEDSEDEILMKQIKSYINNKNT